MIGYSDRINHALAFAAKHHDQEVRKGTRLPYLTHPANVAVILTSYGCAEQIVVAGILYDVVEDCVRDGMTRDTLLERVGRKFGVDTLDMIMSVTERKLNDAGVELSTAARKDDCIERLGRASTNALWVAAADKVHLVNSILSDLGRTAFPETVWGRFSAGHEGTLHWYRRVTNRLREIGFDAPIVQELDTATSRLESA